MNELRQWIQLVEARREAPLYHVSNDPNLVVDANYKPRQGSMGKGFYVTADPRAWKEGGLGGKRSYLYRVDSSPLHIATSQDFPSNRQLTDWAIEKGYMRMAPVVRPSTGEVIHDLDGEPMIRPETTAAAKQFLWQDPMTGNTMNGLQNEYLRDHGFNAAEALYSPEGHQIIIFDLAAVRLTKLKRSR